MRGTAMRGTAAAAMRGTAAAAVRGTAAAAPPRGRRP